MRPVATILIGLAILALAATIAAAVIGASLLIAAGLTLTGLLAVTGITALRRRTKPEPANAVLCGLCCRPVPVDDDGPAAALDQHWDNTCPNIPVPEAEALMGEIQAHLDQRRDDGGVPAC